MQVISEGKEKATIELSTSDLILICNCMNEVLNGFDFEQVYFRLGGKKEYGHKLHESLVEVLHIVSPVNG